METFKLQKTYSNIEEYNKELYNFMVYQEGKRTDIYSDPNNLFTIGIGYNLKTNDWRKDFEEANISLSEEQKKALTDYIQSKDKTKYLASGHTIKLNDEEIDRLYSVCIERAREVLERKFGEEAYKKLDNSDEMITLTSLAYNNPKLIGTNLTKAIKEEDRLKAWYEIRYQSNGDKDHGIQGRRVEEANKFGLFNDNKDKKELIEAVRFLESKRASIEEDLKTCWDNGNVDEKIKQKYSKNDLNEQLNPAKDLLASQYLKGELEFDEKDKDVENVIKKHIELKQNEFLAQFYMNYKNDYNHDNPAYEPSFNDALAWELEKAKEMGDDYVSKEAKEIALRMSNGEDLDLGAEMGLEPTLSSKIDNSAVLAAYQPLLAKEEALEDKKVEIKETNQENLEANQTQQNAYDQEARNQEQIKQQEKVAEQIKKDQEEFEQKKQDLKDKIWNSVKTVASVATFIPPLTAVGLPIKGALLLGKGYAMLKGIRMTHDALELASFAQEAVEYDKEAVAFVNNQTGKVEQVVDNTQGINLENKENLAAQFNPSFS